MTGPRILVVDDDAGTRTKWRDQLASVPALQAARVEPLGGEELQTAIRLLAQRQLSARDTRRPAEYEPACEFDSCDILLVDYDLIGLANVSAVTGEDVAYLARCYSRVGIIVTLNRGGDNTF